MYTNVFKSIQNTTDTWMKLTKMDKIEQNG